MYNGSFNAILSHNNNLITMSTLHSYTSNQNFQSCLGNPAALILT